MREIPPIQQAPGSLVSWRLFWLLALLLVVSALLLIPYTLQFSAKSQPVALTLSSMLQAILLYWPMTLLGLYAAGHLKQGAPLLAAWVSGKSIPSAGWRRLLAPSAVVGFGSGALILALSALFSTATTKELVRLNASLPRQSMPDAWKGFLAAIAAGVNEEILLRLGLLSLVAWGIQWLTTRRTQGLPHRSVFWAANLFAALVFGLLHLPNLTALNVPISPFLMITTTGLNAIAGLGFGWLYWSYGLESAILAHFFMDIVLQVLILPIQAMR